MARAERFNASEEERKRKKELELRLYSRNLSHQLLTHEGKALGSDLPDSAVARFQIGSLRNRDSYWKEREGNLTYGQQMVEWIGGKKSDSGLSQWVARQKDEGVVSILQDIGLKGQHEDVAKGLQEKSVQQVITAINNDLQKIGEPLLDTTQLDDDQARSIIFYATYLNPSDPANPGKDAKMLIDTLVGQAMKESGNDTAKAMELLQKVAPLFRVAGEDGQYALGALTVAKAHAVGDRDELVKLDKNVALTEDEQYVLDFLEKLGDMEAPEGLELGEGNNIKQVFANLTPDATPGHKYFVDRNIPRDFAAKLTPEQLHSLKLTKPMWVMQNGKPMLNREVFDPAYVLEEDVRFSHAEGLTYGDSGLLALAAVSAKTPEEQTELYKQLGETVVATHLANPKLIEEFMRAQTPESLIQFGANENDWTGRLRDRLGQEFEQIAVKALKDTYNIEVPPGTMPQLTKEQQALIQQKGEEFDQQRYFPALLNLEDPERVISFRLQEGQGQLTGAHIAVTDIDATIKGWTPERIKALQETLQKDPLILTLEQIRQIEFLSHAVNTARVMEMLKGTAQIGQPEVQTPVAPEIPETVAVPAPVAREEAGVLENENEHTPEVVTEMKLGDFFQKFDQLEQRTGITGRQELAIIDSTHMAQISTLGEDVSHFEVTNEENNLGLYIVTASENEEGKMQHYYNERNPFLNLIFADNSLSRHSFEQLKSPGYGPNILLAYVLEASKDPSQQEALLKNVFLQVAAIYKEHPDLMTKIPAYFNAVNEQVSDKPMTEMEWINRLFQTPEDAEKRLTELTTKLTENSSFTVRDFADMGLFALPFNLETIAERMEVAYRSHHATSEPPQAE